VVADHERSGGAPRGIVFVTATRRRTSAVHLSSDAALLGNPGRGKVVPVGCLMEHLVPPALVLLMRHAEKPADPNDPHLSNQGMTRAEKLAVYIPETFGDRQLLFASATSKHSARSYETLKPLAQKLGVPIDATYADKDYAALATQLLVDHRYAGQRIAIAWHHGRIPAFANALGAPKGQYPDPWDPLVFALILKFEWPAANRALVTMVTGPF
jgi:phosphohistidine phosphatase SixA